MGFSNDIALTFGISANASDARAALVGLETELYNMAAATAETGAHFKDLSVETGISTQTLSAFSLGAKLAGTDLDTARTSLNLYLKNLSEAAHGNTQAAENFKRFGIDAKTAIKDPDQAVQDLLDRLAKIPNEAERLDAAYKLAGRSGAILARIAGEMGGSFDQLKQKADELGVSFSEKDAQAAKDFEVALTLLEEEGKGLAYTFGKEVGPEITKAFDDIGSALGTSGSLWKEWSEGIAIDIATARGAVEGFAKAVREGDLDPAHVIARTILGGEEAAGQFARDKLLEPFSKSEAELNAQLARMRAGSGGVGDVSQRGAADKARNEAARRIEEENRQIEESYRHHVEELQRDFNLEITSSKTYTENLIKEATKRYDGIKENLDKEAALYKPGTSGAEKVAAEQQKALDERDKTVRAAKDAQDKREIDALKAHREALLKLADTYDEESIAAIESNAELGALTYEQAEDKKFKIQTDAYDRRLQALADDEANFYAAQKDINDVNQEQAQAYSDAIMQTQEDQERAQQEHDRRVDEGRKKDLQREREYRQAMKQLRQQAVADDIAIQRMELEAAGAQGSAPGANPTIAERVNIIRQLADLDRKAEEERHKQTLDSIRQQEDAAKRQAELDHQTFEDEKTFNQLRENEARRHSQAMGKIQRQQQEGEDEADPLKGAIDNLKKTTSVTDFLSNQAAAGLLKMRDAFGQAIEANLLYGQSIGKAMKAALAEYLAHVAAESAIEALRQTAWGVAMFAEGNFASAAGHFEAAALFGALAIGSGLAASSLAKSAGLRGDSSATSGSSAGQAITSTATPAAPTTISLGRPGGAPDPNVVHLIVETHTTNDPGTLTEHIITTIDKNGQAQRAVATAFQKQYNGNHPVRTVLHADLG